MKPYEAALSLYGLREITGHQDNPIIVQMFNDMGYDGAKLKDETSWCALLVGWCCKVTGHKHTGRLDARSYLKLEEETNDPVLGDIVVFWRESIESWKGHVGFYIRTEGNYVWVLGGNQSNQLIISRYLKSRVLGYRKPTNESAIIGK